MERTLESTWVFESGLEPLWNALFDLQKWPCWWPAFRSVEALKRGDEYGVGASYRLDRAQEALICEAIEPHLLELHTGQSLARWTLSEEDSLAFVHLTLWNPGCLEILRPETLSQGARGLSRHLKARLVEAGSWSCTLDKLFWRGL